MPQDFSEIVFLIVVGTILILLMVGFIIFMIFLHRTRQLKNKEDMLRTKQNFEQALLQTRLEIQEQTLKHVAREIHDNIGQVLSFIKLNLNTVHLLPEAEKKESIHESKTLISKVITDLRDLSKSLGMDHLAHKGLIKTIAEDLNRLRKSGIFLISFNVEGSPYNLHEQHELIIYRIFQESIANIIKHSKAKNIDIRLDYRPELFNLMIVDDGIGFNPNAALNKSGSGLTNIKNRAKLLGAETTITSTPGNGCSISLSLGTSPENETRDGNYSNSIG